MALSGRAREFAAAMALVAPGRGVMVRGAAGSGRTTLASAIADAAAGQGMSPMWVATTASLGDVPFGALAGVLSGDAAAADTPARMMAAIVSAMRFHGGSAPTVLVIDDAHLLDVQSCNTVLQAVSGRAVGLVLTVAHGARMPGALARLLDDRFLDVVDLEPFDRATVAEVTAALIGGQPSEATLELLWRWSGGIPSVLTEIVTLGAAEGRFEPAEGQWWWSGAAPKPDQLGRWVEGKLADLSEAATDALCMVALAGWVAVAELEAVVGVGALVELEQCGLIDTCDEGDGLLLRCDVPLVASALVERMPPLRRRAAAQRLLDALPAPRSAVEVARAARTHVHTGRAAPTDVMTRAVNVLRLSDPELAMQIAEVNHRWSPGIASLVSMLFNEIETGDVAGARALLAQAIELATGEAEHFRLVEAEFAVRLFGDRDPIAARRVLAKADTAGAGVAGAAAIVTSLETLASVLSARPDLAHHHARSVLAMPDAPDPARLRAGVGMVASLLIAGQTGAARRIAAPFFELASAMTDRMASALGIMRAEMAFIDLWRGELTPLPAHPGTGRWPAPPVAADQGAFTWALMAGIVAHLRGDHDEAITRLREAVVQQAAGKGIFHAEASAWLVVALCDGGSRSAADAALARFPERHLAVLPGLADWARGVHACTHGDVGRGAELLASAAAQAAAAGAHLCEARYLVELVERCGTDDHIGRVDELAQVLDAPLLQLLCHSAVARLKGDADTMLEAAASLANSGLVPRAASLYREVERLARRNGDARLARDAAGRRRALGGATPEANEGAHPLLSKREAEVAGLAGGGLSDREIAARLVVSVRTVESHLASAYRKLGIASRAELALAPA